jgi:hypothetical protein
MPLCRRCRTAFERVTLVTTVMTPSLLRQAPLFVILFVVFDAIVLACNKASDEDYVVSGTPERIDQSTLDATPISVQYVLENPSAYESKRFALEARVVDVWSVRAFTVIGQQFPANDTLLVVATDEVAALKDGTGSVVVQGAIVRVTGTVRTDGIEAVAHEFGIELSKVVHSLARVKGPVFVAERVVKVR